MSDAAVEELLGAELAELEAVAAALRPLVVQTPLLPSLHTPGVWLKAENLQRTHSFKLRAACNTLRRLPPEAGPRGIVTSSSGNFAQAVACASASLGLDAKIVMMRSSNPAKVAATRSWGATVVFCEDRYESRLETVAEICEREDRWEVFPFDHPDVVRGNASVGLEIVACHPGLRHLVVPTSGGGLLAGAGLASRLLAPEVTVWGVQPEGSNAAALSFAAGRRVSIEAAHTIADGITVTRPGALTFPVIQETVHDIVTVSENSIRRAIQALLEEKLVVEPAGAVSLAAVLEGRIPAEETVCVLSGGNISPSLLAELSG